MDRGRKGSEEGRMEIQKVVKERDEWMADRVEEDSNGN